MGARWSQSLRLLPAARCGYPGTTGGLSSLARLPGRHCFRNPSPEPGCKWWIFWGRLAGGLKRNQQIDLTSAFAFPPAAQRQRPENNASLLREWGARSPASSYCHTDEGHLGDALISKVRSGNCGETELWCSFADRRTPTILRTGQPSSAA